MRSRELRLPKSALFLTVLVACSAPERSHLPGTYVVRYPHSTETLVLDDDGSYSQYIKPLEPNNPSVRHSGTWKYERDFRRLVLEDALLVDDALGRISPSYRTPRKGIWGMPVRRNLRGVVLVVNEDLGFQFRRVGTDEPYHIEDDVDD